MAALCGKPETNSMWLRMATNICRASFKLKQLVIRGTRTSAEEGLALLDQLSVKSEGLTTLEHIDLTGHSSWFGGKQRPVDLMFEIFQMNPSLNFILMINCGLTNDQK